ncbi:MULTISPECIES: glutathione transferase GstA [Enterobacteriaceae]|jgi:glutathione S-transferase|uniref:Glutathione transferase GstA n=2 Tax=Enterobacteriaceae TaxID=543 RepID=A0ABW1Q1T1_9ENTR|nr:MULTISPECIES: glutathione transferase GstA [Phytobacter]AUU91391.1 glutathione transferase GstA [Enterobacteriaceae bacterium ENNIH3]AUV08592.1 glutathione transferase GstA [Enterobacteriaceae bacterium ENNIH2]MBS6736772.1 glutathione transferase GstA [Enterobacteriaceae bacterium]PTA96090.1 glutathione transferase GstA [Kluyvera sp. Nf5]PWF50174.1 glutathione transferase GstA [[Kluyvera] intestini]
MKLFYKPGACSLASHIVLREAGKEFELARVDLAKKCLENGDDFLAINPKGQIPALAINADTLLTEGVAIMQYVADSAPKSDLLPPVGFLSRYKTLEWLNFVATELHKGFTPLFRPDTPEAFKPTARALLEKKLEYVDAALADQQWINGENFSIADAYLFTVLRWAVAVKLNFPQAGNIANYMQRVASRPAVAAAMAAEGI